MRGEHPKIMATWAELRARAAAASAASAGSSLPEKRDDIVKQMDECRDFIIDAAVDW